MNYPERTEEEERERREAEDRAGENRMEQEREMKGRVMPTEEGMMNEQDMRVIYEWLKPELKGKPWTIEAYHCVGCGFPWQEARYEEPSKARTPYTRMTLPPLDMNTWHGIVVPKLIAEGCEYVNTEYHIDSGYSCCILGPAGEPNIEGAAQDEWAIDIVYAALLDYIKAVQK